ncbi:MAG: hypothetical protein HY316_11335 [Acidobacteria bacterium]|nr:hypothetical protein [Acidobacteriota bacterium]
MRAACDEHFDLGLHRRRTRRWGASAFLVLTALWADLCLAQQAAAPATPQAAPSTPGQGIPPGAIPQPGQRRVQAKTPEESAAYQAFIEATRPEDRIRLVEDFLLQYPETELKESAFQTAMQAYQLKNDYQHLLTYGELTLAQNQDNLTALLTLAATISERTQRTDSDRDEKLNEGDQYALRALEVIGKLRKPPGFPDERWLEFRHQTESAAHASRGLIALIREDFVKAELELKEAVALAKEPDAVLLYRLGLTYSLQRKYAQALEVLERAASRGGIRIADASGKTRDLVEEAREFAAKALPPAPPAVPEPPAAASAPLPSPAP